MLICHLYVFIADISVQIFYLLFTCFFSPYCWVLMILCIFWTDIFYQIYILKIFSFCQWLFIVLTWFCRTEISDFNKVQFIVFSFMGHTFGGVFTNSSSNEKSCRFFLFFSRIFKFCIFHLSELCQVFRCIYLIFAYKYPIYLVPFVKMTIFIHQIAFHPFSQISWLCCVGLFLNFYSFHWPMCLFFYPIPQCLDAMVLW